MMKSMPVLLLVLFVALPSSAALLLYEPFDYAADVPLHGQGSGQLGFDAGSTWNYQAGDGIQTVDILAGGMTFGDLVVGGNKGRNSSTNANNEIGEALRPIDFSVSTGALWMSYLYRSNASAQRTGRGMRIQSAAGGNDFGAFGKRNNEPGSVGVLTYGGTVANSPVGLSQSTPYLILAKWDSLGTTSGDAVMWYVNEAEFSSFDNDGMVTEAELNTISADRITSLTEAGTPVVSADGIFQLAVVDTTTTGRHAWWFDELRVGQSVADVTPIVIPEPSALALLALGLVLLGGCAHRR